MNFHKYKQIPARQASVSSRENVFRNPITGHKAFALAMVPLPVFHELAVPSLAIALPILLDSPDQICVAGLGVCFGIRTRHEGSRQRA